MKVIYFIFTWGEVRKGLLENKVKATTGWGSIRKLDMTATLESLCMCMFEL